MGWPRDQVKRLGAFSAHLNTRGSLVLWDVLGCLSGTKKAEGEATGPMGSKVKIDGHQMGYF